MNEVETIVWDLGRIREEFFGEELGTIFEVYFCAERRRKHALPRGVNRARAEAYGQRKEGRLKFVGKGRSAVGSFRSRIIN